MSEIISFSLRDDLIHACPALSLVQLTSVLPAASKIIVGKEQIVLVEEELFFADSELSYKPEQIFNPHRENTVFVQKIRLH